MRQAQVDLGQAVDAYERKCFPGAYTHWLQSQLAGAREQGGSALARWTSTQLALALERRLEAAVQSAGWRGLRGPERPIPSLLLPGLWQGGVMDDDPGFVASQGISHVLSIGSRGPPAKVTGKHVNKPDTYETDLLGDFSEAVAFIHTARCAGARVYVHCAKGISRASTMTAAYLIAHLGLSVEEALHYLRLCRPCVNPHLGFVGQLQEWAAGGAAEAARGLRAARDQDLVAKDLAHVQAVWKGEMD